MTPRRTSTGVFGIPEHLGARVGGLQRPAGDAAEQRRHGLDLVRRSRARPPQLVRLVASTRRSARSASSAFVERLAAELVGQRRARPEPPSVHSAGSPQPRAIARAMFPEPMRPTRMP